MSNKKVVEKSIIEVREASRSLGMHRGRITRKMHTKKIVSIRLSQLAFLNNIKNKDIEQHTFVNILLSNIYLIVSSNKSKYES